MSTLGLRPVGISRVFQSFKDEKILVAKGNMMADDKAALKATGWMTNSKFILDELTVLCSSDGKCSPEKLCYSILKGLRKQLNKDKICLLYTSDAADE